MKAVILAAGQGTRLRDIAPSKPLAPVLGVALIERVVDATAKAGITEFVVVTGYEAAGLEAFLAELAQRRGLTIQTVFNADWRSSNGLSVVAARPLLDGPFVILMSDHLFDPAILRGLIADTKGRDDRLTLAVDRRLANPLVDMDDVTRVETGPGGAIVHIGKHLTPFDAFDTGLFVAPLSLADAIRADTDGGGVSLSAGVQRLAKAGKAFTWDIGDRFWLDVDDAIAFGHAEREEARTVERS